MGNVLHRKTQTEFFLLQMLVFTKTPRKKKKKENRKERNNTQVNKTTATPLQNCATFYGLEI